MFQNRWSSVDTFTMAVFYFEMHFVEFEIGFGEDHVAGKIEFVLLR